MFDAFEIKSNKKFTLSILRGNQHSESERKKELNAKCIFGNIASFQVFYWQLLNLAVVFLCKVNHYGMINSSEYEMTKIK